MDSSLWTRGTLYERLDIFRAALDAQQTQSIARLLTVYAQTQQATMTQFEELAAIIQRDIAAGKPFGADKLRRMTRYQDLLRATDQRLSDYAVYASSETQRLQLASIRVAEQQARALYEAAVADDLVLYPNAQGRGALPPGVTMEDIRRQFNALPQGIIDDITGAVGDGTPLRNYFLNGTANIEPLSLKVVQGIEDALINGFSTSQGPAVIARKMTDALAIGSDRALRIARTESNRVARVSAHASYIENSDVIVGWRWVANLGPTTCAACVAMDGSIHPLTEELRDHPNGGCQPAPVTRLGAERGDSFRRVKDENGEYQIIKGDGKEWFKQQPESVQRRILKPAGYKAWKSGEVQLNQFVRTQTNETFGANVVQGSLKSILGESKAAEFYQGAQVEQ